MPVQRRVAPPDQALAFVGYRLRQSRSRQQFDELLDVLEERNLRGQRHVDRPLREWVRNLEVASGVAIPRRLLRARNTARLHDALLDWMETLLDALVSGGPHLADDATFEAADE